MRHHVRSLKERRRSDPLGTIDDLGRNDEVSGSDLFAKRADGGEGDDGFDAEGGECCDVCACGDGGGADGVGGTVASEEGDFGTRGKGCDGYRGARKTPWLLEK